MKAVRAAAVAVLLVSAMLGAAHAMPPVPKKPEDRYMLAKDNYQRAMQMYRSAKQEYSGMGGMFGRGPPEDVLRLMLLRAIDAMLAHIELVKARAEVSTLSEEEKARIYAKLDAHADFLKQKREEAEKAESRRELVEIAKEVRAGWAEARVALKSAAGSIAVSRLSYVIERAEEIGDRLEVRIAALEQAGYDTSELERLLSEYRDELEAAGEKTAAAEEKFSAISSPANAALLFREGRQELREAQRHLRRMFGVLREIIVQLRQAEPGQAEAAGFGYLYASGNGSVALEGSGGVLLAGRGRLTVRVDRGRLSATGWGDVLRHPDGSATYRGEGKVKVTGRGIWLRAEGEELVLRAYGRGAARLNGSGVWRTSGMRGEWSGEVSYGGGE